MDIEKPVRFKKNAKGLHAREKKRYLVHGEILGIVVGMRKPGICTIRLQGEIPGLSYKRGDEYYYVDILERYLIEA